MRLESQVLIMKHAEPIRFVLPVAAACATAGGRWCSTGRSGCQRGAGCESADAPWAPRRYTRGQYEARSIKLARRVPRVLLRCRIDIIIAMKATHD
eukprot:855117-Pleurochrysis_carterae.AAC.2